MDRVIPAAHKLEPSTAIAGAMSEWLMSEVASSNAGRNTVLNEWGEFRENGEAKNQGHFDRLELWTDLFSKNSRNTADPELISKQLFGVQMELSGIFRVWCFLRSGSPGQYMRERESRPLSVDIYDEVDAHLTNRFGYLPNLEGNLQAKTVDATDLVEETRLANKLKLDTHQRIFEDEKLWQADKPRFGRRLGHMIRLSDLQKKWLAVGVDYILHAAHVSREGLQGVEFLEPKSITEGPQPFKPFVPVKSS